MAGASLFFDIFARDNNVEGTLDKIGKKGDDTGKKMEGLGGKISGLAAPAGIALGAIGGLAFKFGNMAAEAEQNTGAVETVFGAAAEKVEQFASRSADAVGLSESQYNQLSATTGTALKAAGVSVDQLAEKNDQLISRGADLASVFGGTTAEAVQAMGSAFRGEFDPLERYGITLNMNSVNAELAARGLDGLSGAAAETAKKQVIMDLIFQQSTASAGNFAKEADTTAGAQQRANASFDDAQAKLGEALLPALTGLADILKVSAKWIGDNSGLVMTLAAVLAVLAGGILAVNAAQFILNLTMAANPIGLVILAVAGLIAVIVALAMNWDKVTAFVSDNWNKFSQWFSDGMGKIGRQWNDLWSGVGKFVSDAWNNVIIKPLDALKGWMLNDIPNAFRDGIKWVEIHWNKLQDNAKAPVRFLVNTVINDGLIGTFNTVAGWVGIGKLGRVALPAGFAQGGYTGEGSKHDPAGIVHAGEFVFTKEQTENAGVANLYRLARTLQRGYAQGGFVSPVPSAVISQGFSGINGHNGIDMAAPTGTPIRAAFNGNVTFAGWSSYGGGNEIHIVHPGGWETWYAHLSGFNTQPGRTVNRGAMIGRVGSTGNSTGSHLHYMVMRGGWPNVVDPSGYLDPGQDIPAGGLPFDPIGDIAKGLLNGLRSAFPAGALAADLAFGFGGKALGDVGKFVMGKLGMGSTYGPRVFDDGGWLDTVGANHSGRPEAVFNDVQWQTMHTLAQRGASLDGYTLELNAEMTRATLRRDARSAAIEVLEEGNMDMSRGRAR